MKSLGNRVALRFTASLKRLVGTPYKAARSASVITRWPRTMRIWLPINSKGKSPLLPSLSMACSVRGSWILPGVGRFDSHPCGCTPMQNARISGRSSNRRWERAQADNTPPKRGRWVLPLAP
jgi:hypothetical protein